MNIPAFLITVGVSIGLSIFFYLKANTRVYRIASVLGLSTGFVTSLLCLLNEYMTITTKIICSKSGTNTTPTNHVW